MKPPATAPLVTIVTVTYNLIKADRSEDIIRCLEAVHQQDYPSVEHLIIDGGSTDGTLDLLHPYEEKGWIKIYSEPDKGIYDAMNKGIARASGKYINFMNSDDYFATNEAVKLSVEKLEKTGSDISYSDWWEECPHKFQEGNLAKIFFSMPFCHQTAFCKTSLLRDLKGFDRSIKIAADRDLLFRAFKGGAKFTKIAVPLINFKLGGLSTQNMNDTVADDYKVFKLHLQHYTSLSEEQYLFAFQNSIIPLSAIRKQVCRQPLSVRWSCYFYVLHNKSLLWLQHLASIRHWLLTIRTRKGKRCLRLLGVHIIKEKKQ